MNSNTFCQLQQLQKTVWFQQGLKNKEERKERELKQSKEAALLPEKMELDLLQKDKQWHLLH